MKQKQLPLFEVEPYSLKPKIGEVRAGRGIGKKDFGHKFIWLACPECGKERWVVKTKLKLNKPLLCHKCSAKRERAAQWKGGRRKDFHGYITVKLQPDNFFYPMATKQEYVLEHRLVMAQYLHRCLLPWEVVHHKNAIKDDNRLENLELLPGQYKHSPFSLMEKEIQQLRQRVTQLEAEVTLLTSQLEKDDSRLL